MASWNHFIYIIIIDHLAYGGLNDFTRNSGTRASTQATLADYIIFG